eukprot:365702-Chlamydomonas_euryale.AAC.12
MKGRAVGLAGGRPLSGGVWLVATPCLLSVFCALPLQLIFDRLHRLTQAYPFANGVRQLGPPIGSALCNSDSDSDWMLGLIPLPLLVSGKALDSLRTAFTPWK